MRTSLRLSLTWTVNASGVTTFGDGVGNDRVGGNVALSFVTTDAVGSTVLKTSSVTTTGDQWYHDAVVLASNDQTANTTLNGVNVSFDSAVDATTSGAQGLTVNASGVTTFGDGVGNDRVGDTVALSFLTTDAAGATVLKSSSVTTTGDQSYHDTIVLDSNDLTPDTTLNGMNVLFDSTVDGTTSGAQGLTVNASGATTFGNGIGNDRVGGTVALSFLTTDAAGTTVLKSSSVTTTGDQWYHDTVVLASNDQTPNTTLTGVNVSFDNTIDGTTSGAQGLTVNASGVTTFGDGVGNDRVGGTLSLSFLITDAAGSTVLKTSSVTTTGDQAYHDAVVLATNDQTPNTTLNGVNVSFDSTLDGTNVGTQGLTVNSSGTTTFGDGFGNDRVGATALSFLTTDAAGATILKTSSVTTTGDQSYHDTVVLASNNQNSNTVLNATNVKFDRTLDATTSGAQGLTINATGVTTFGDGLGDDSVGGLQALAFLVTDSAGTTVLKSTSVTTTGDQTYLDAVVLASNDQSPDTTLNGFNISFASTLDASASGNQGLTVNAAGITTFGDGIGNDRVGGGGALSFVTTDANGATIFKTSSIVTTGNQTYHDAVTVAGNDQSPNTVLTGVNVSFDSTIDASTAGGQGLTVNASGITTFGDGVNSDAVGGATALSFVTTDAAGVTIAHSSSVTTTGDQTYKDTIVLAGNDQSSVTVLTGTNISFGSTVDGATAGTQGLVVNASGVTTFGDGTGDDRVGSGQTLSFLTTDGAGTTVIKSTSVTTSGDQTYHDAVILASNSQTADKVMTGVNVSFGSSLDAASSGIQGLTVNSSATTTFGDGIGDDSVGARSALAFLTTDSAGSTVLKSSSVTVTGDQSYHDKVILASNDQTSDTVLNAINVSFDVTLDGATSGTQGLTINASGATRLGDGHGDDRVGGIEALAFLITDAAGTTIIKSTSVTTAGNQDFGDAVILGTNDLTVNKTLNGLNVSFDSTLDSDAAGAHGLSVNSSGTTTFGDGIGNDLVGGRQALSFLITDAAGLTVIKSSGVTTTGNQEYGDAVQLGSNDQSPNTTLNGINVLFDNALDASSAGAQGLTVNSTGVTVFGDGTGNDRVGGVAALAFITTDAAGSTLLKASSVSTTGNQSYHDQVSVVGNDQAQTVTLSGLNISFDQTVDGTTAGAQGLIINASGVTTFGDGIGNDFVGGRVSLSFLTTDAAGQTIIKSAGISTVGDQTYRDAVFLASNDQTANTTLNGANISFASSLDATVAGAQGLTINSPGQTTFGDGIGNDRVGANASLAFVSTDAAGSTVLKTTSVTTSGDQSYHDAVVLGSNDQTPNTTLTGLNVSFDKSLDGTISGVQGLIINAAAVTTFGDGSGDDKVGGSVALASLTTDAAGITLLKSTSVTTTGDQVYLDQVVILSNDQTAKTSFNVDNLTFGNTLNASGSHGQDLSINAAGDVLFVGAVGNNAALRDFVIQTAHNVIEQSGVAAATLTQITGSGLTTLNGAINTDAAAGVSISNGAITVNAVVNAVSHITLTSLNPGGDITIASTLTTASGTGEVALRSLQGGIINGAGSSVVNVVSNSLVMSAIHGIGSSANALQTKVSTLAAQNSGSGSIRIDNLTGQLLTISTLDGVHGIQNLGTGIGDVTISNNASIMVSALPSQTDGQINNRTGGNITLQTKGGAFDITVNSPIAASGGNGNITLTAGRNLEINDTGETNDVWSAGTGTVYLNAINNIKLGSQDPNAPEATQHNIPNDVVIRSGTGSITNTLPLIYDIQSPQITAEGVVVLSGTFGRPGEHNFTITVYWGDGTSTTQTFADPGTFSFSHTYHGNPNKDDQSAPILVNVQVAHDPHVVLTAPNVNSMTQSVPDSGVSNPPPVPNPNINSDLSSAIYNPGDPNYQALHSPNSKIVSASGNEATPGTVIFQDIAIRATAVPVPGEGLATFPYDVTPPVIYLHFPEQTIVIDLHDAQPLQLSQQDTLRLELGSDIESVASERQVFLEILREDGSIEKIRLPENVLDDLLKTISNLPDGRYRFQLLEPGESRQRLLLDTFDVRQGKIVDPNDDGERPPTSGNKSEPPAVDASGQRPMSSIAPGKFVPSETNEFADFDRDSDNAGPVGSPGDLDDSHSPSIWGDWSSQSARSAWKRAQRATDEFIDQTVQSSENESTQPEAQEAMVMTADEPAQANLGAVVLIGAAVAGMAKPTDVKKIGKDVAGRFGRAARLFRKFGSHPK